jgi:hypothetical protein
LPVANPEAAPPLETLTIRGSEELQVTLPLTFVVELLDQVAVAVSCVVPPITTVGSPGVIEIELNVWPRPGAATNKMSSTRTDKRNKHAKVPPLATRRRRDTGRRKTPLLLERRSMEIDLI